jgi:hypothetical protein
VCSSDLLHLQQAEQDIKEAQQARQHAPAQPRELIS